MEERGIASGSLLHDDRSASVRFLEIPNLFLDEIECLVPADALPLVFPAVFVGALHGILQAVFCIHGLNDIEASHAQGSAAVPVGGVAFDLLELALFVYVGQYAAAVMASRRRPLRSAVDGIVALLPMVEIAAVDVGVVLVPLQILLSHRLTSFSSCSSLSYASPKRML